MMKRKMMLFVVVCLFMPHVEIKPHVFDVNISMSSPLVEINKEVNIYNH